MGMFFLQLSLVLSLFPFDSASGTHGPATNFSFPDGFQSSNQFLLVDDALYNKTSQSVLLTANSSQTKKPFSCGMFFYHEKVAIRDSSFSTTLTFTIRSPYDSWGDGFAFTFREDAGTKGAAGEYLCLLNSTTNAIPSNYVFAVEFDTFMNSFDPSNNHIGVDMHAIRSEFSYNLCGDVIENCTYLVNRGDFTAWIDYDNPTQILEVRFCNGSSRGQGVQRPTTAIVSRKVDLNSAVANEMYVGFVGATGLEFELHEIKSWTFKSSYAPAASRSKLIANKKLALGLSIPLAALAVLSFVACGVVYHRLQKQSATLRDLEQELVRQQVQPCLYSYNDIKTATRDFHPTNKLGEGGFGIVYKGTLPDGTQIAAKKLLRSGHHAESFLNEVVLITGIRHRNLVKLRGCCIKDKQQILVYEYVENKNLAEALWGPNNKYILDWLTRFKICEGIARGLSYLHEDSQPRIIHRDIKANNILLDMEWRSKIADFGLARLFPDEESHLTTMHIAGTMGYMAPEYATRGQLTDKADVYSFGVLLLEVISGRKNIDHTAPPERVYLLEWAWTCYEENCLFDLLDDKLSVDEVPIPEVHRVLMIAMFCLQPSPSRRPSMSSVLAMLLGEEKMEMVMRSPNISDSGEHALSLAQIHLSSPC